LTALEATLAAGCDDLHECASTDCCPSRSWNWPPWGCRA